MIASILNNPAPYAIALILIIGFIATLINSVKRNTKNKHLINDTMAKRQTKKEKDELTKVSESKIAEKTPATEETIETVQEPVAETETISTEDVGSLSEVFETQTLEEPAVSVFSEENETELEDGGDSEVERPLETNVETYNDDIQEAEAETNEQEMPDNQKMPVAGQSLGHVHDNQ